MNNRLKIKVCGMKYPENREAVEALGIDLLGFIFYPLSKRYVGELDEVVKMRLLATEKEKVGVFVNEKILEIKKISKKYSLDYIQLHGDERPEYCQKLQSLGIKIIKAFRVDEDFDFTITVPFSGIADFLLFDTKSDLFGGTGKKFDWQVLNNYKGEASFFLSGGIKPEDAETIKMLKHPKLYGVDLNSGFEEKPGFKNIDLLKHFINEISG
jgi:phosphoribosylanthranilate isomerase